MRGGNVRIIIHKDHDSKMVDAAAETCSQTVNGEGAAVFLFQHRMNHSRTWVVDDSFSIVVTSNLDNRSFRTSATTASFNG